MTDDPTINRRRLLELTSVGTGIAVAGCMNQLNDDGGDGGEGDGESRQVTMQVQIDQQGLQARQQELAQEVRAGNTTQQEARQEIQSLQQEAAEDAIESAESEFESSSLTIEDRISSQGVLLVTGSDGDILDTLDTDLVSLIAPASLFEEARTLQQQQQQQPRQQQPRQQQPQP